MNLFKHAMSLTLKTMLMGGVFGLMATSASATTVLVQTEITANGSDYCSILRIAPDGTLSEQLTDAQRRGATNNSSCDFSDTGMAAAPNGVVYFVDDGEDSIVAIDVQDNARELISDAALSDLIETSADVDNGLVFGDDGNLYIADEDCNCIVKATLSTSGLAVKNLEILVPEAAFETPELDSSADFVGGIARMPDGTLYVTNDTGNNGIYVVSPSGVVDWYFEETELETLLSVPTFDVDLDVERVGSDLYVGEDDSDGIFKIDTLTDEVSWLAEGDDLRQAIVDFYGVTPSPNFQIETEGGFAYNAARQSLYVAARFDSEFSDTGAPQGTILEVDFEGNVSVVVPFETLVDFYETVYPNLTDIDFVGNATFVNEPPQQVDATSSWSLWALFVVLLTVSGVALRRF